MFEWAHNKNCGSIPLSPWFKLTSHVNIFNIFEKGWLKQKFLGLYCFIVVKFIKIIIAARSTKISFSFIHFLHSHNSNGREAFHWTTKMKKVLAFKEFIPCLLYVCVFEKKTFFFYFIFRIFIYWCFHTETCESFLSWTKNPLVGISKITTSRTSDGTSLL